MRRDLLNSINTKYLFAPIAAQTNSSTARVSAIIDTAGYESCTFVLIDGTNTDADATFAVTLEHGDDSALADTAVPAATDLIGTTALAGFTFADDNLTRKIGYIGAKRYVRVTVTPTGNNSGDWFMAGVAILGHAKNRPTVNPPVA